MATTSMKVGHGLAKALGIKLNYRNELDEQIRRGESVFSLQSTDVYVEEEPSSLDWLLSQIPTGHQLQKWFISLFPFLAWIGRYNAQWLAGDLVAGKLCLFCSFARYTNQLQV
jgi:sodium-independent sulfate anion transporter 11